MLLPFSTDKKKKPKKMLLLFDTNTFTNYRNQLDKADEAHLAVSMVVWYELTANTINRNDWQYYEALRQRAAQAGRLFTPTMNDWRETAKLVARLRFQDKRSGHGKTPPLADATRLQNDALIARTAFLHHCTVVTANLKDFERIRTFLKFNLLDAAEYFAL